MKERLLQAKKTTQHPLVVPGSPPAADSARQQAFCWHRQMASYLLVEKSARFLLAAQRSSPSAWAQCGGNLLAAPFIQYYAGPGAHRHRSQELSRRFALGSCVDTQLFFFSTPKSHFSCYHNAVIKLRSERQKLKVVVSVHNDVRSNCAW